ncbi:uncharacterized protein LOC142760415 [Rhinoderma darwinii]|uniref:uncharacterized protein LOC142760415 n=1 Tax=Rhinoderma darwinii TaxID=43563 RepID=UPI003F676747
MPRQMDVGKLIRLVQEWPEVWNTHAESYHDRTLKEAAWEQIAEALFEQEWADSRTRDRLQIVDDVKRRWRSSRDQFRREHGSGARSGDGGPQKRRYMYYDQLLFLREIMDMRPTSDTLDASEEEARPQCSQASEAAAPLVALTPEATREDPGPVASAPEAGQPDQVAPRQAAPRRRRPGNPPAAAQVDARVLEYLRRAADEDQHDFFCRSMAPLMRRVPEDRLVRLQINMLSLIDCATPPLSPGRCFTSLEHWRSVYMPSARAHVPRPSQPAPVFSQMAQYPPAPRYLSPAPMPGPVHHFPQYSIPGPSLQAHMQPQGYHPQYQPQYAVQEQAPQGRGQQSGAERSGYSSPTHAYQNL